MKKGQSRLDAHVIATVHDVTSRDLIVK